MRHIGNRPAEGVQLFQQRFHENKGSVIGKHLQHDFGLLLGQRSNMAGREYHHLQLVLGRDVDEFDDFRIVNRMVLPFAASQHARAEQEQSCEFYKVLHSSNLF